LRERFQDWTTSSIDIIRLKKSSEFRVRSIELKDLFLVFQIRNPCLPCTNTVQGLPAGEFRNWNLDFS
jgi:hypothetical protein